MFGKNKANTFSFCPLTLCTVGCPAHCKSITRNIPWPIPERMSTAERQGVCTSALLCVFHLGSTNSSSPERSCQCTSHICRLGPPAPSPGLCATQPQGVGSSPSGHPGAHQALAAPLPRHGKRLGPRGGEGGEGKKGTHCSGAESGKLHRPPGAKPGGNPGYEHGSPDPPGDLWAGNCS